MDRRKNRGKTNSNKKHIKEKLKYKKQIKNNRKSQKSSKNRAKTKKVKKYKKKMKKSIDNPKKIQYYIKALWRTRIWAISSGGRALDF